MDDTGLSVAPLERNLRKGVSYFVFMPIRIEGSQLVELRSELLALKCLI